MNPGTGSDHLHAEPVGSKKSTESKFAEKLADSSNVNNTNNDQFTKDHYQQSVERRFFDEAELPKNWDALTTREKRDWSYAHVTEKWKTMPKGLRFLYVGSSVMGERTSLDVTPEWLDHDKYLRGQRFGMKFLSGQSFAQLLSIYPLLMLENVLTPLILTGKSGDPYAAFQRYLSTAKRIRNWFSTDVWSRDTLANQDLRAVRKMHAAMHERLVNSSLEEIKEATKMDSSWSVSRERIQRDFRESCPAATSGQCPSMFKTSHGISQAEMAITQFSFVGLIVLYPESFGIHGYTDRDLDDFCHVWRCLGYLLGIEDEFNFCTDSLEEVKQRSRDFIEYWVKPNLRDGTPEWEHMVRCFTEGVWYYFPTCSYEQGWLHLADLLEIPMPRMRQSIDYSSWIRYLYIKYSFKWLARIPGYRALMNRQLNKAIDRALEFTDKELAPLKEKSKKTLAQGIAETAASTSQEEPVAASTHWHKIALLIFLSIPSVMTFLNILKQLARKLLPGDVSLMC